MDTPAQSQERLFRAALEAVPDAVVVVDGHGVVVLANAQVKAVFGYEPDDLEGHSVEDLVPPSSRRAHPGLRLGYTRRPMGLLPLAAVRRDGVEFPAEISLAPIPELGGAFTVATIRDISERLRLEREAERMRDDLLATVTHELRTPLTSIIGNAELMADLPEEQLGRQARRFLDVISRNAARELKLVTDLLSMAVDSLNRPDLDLAVLDIGALAQETVRLRRLQARERGLTLSVQEASGEMLVNADAHRLVQVFDNLISNAVKFTPPGGRVDVVVERTEDHITVTFTDTGVGMDPADQTRVFERLYRASNAVRNETPGAGLGLAISRSIVEAHGGRIELTSKPAEGTSVTVQLPSA